MQILKRWDEQLGKTIRIYYCNLIANKHFGYKDKGNMCSYFTTNIINLSNHKKLHLEIEQLCKSEHIHGEFRCKKPLCIKRNIILHEYHQYKEHLKQHSLGKLNTFPTKTECPIHRIECLAYKDNSNKIRVICPKEHIRGKIISNDITKLLRDYHRRIEFFHEERY